MPNLTALSHIINASISATAKILWMIMAMSVDEKQTMWVRQATLAEQLKCSKSTVGRMLRVLKEAKLIVDTGKRHAGKYKIYELNQGNPLPILTSQNLPLPKGEGNKPKVKAAGDDVADKLLAQHGESWRRRYTLLDGKDGRHTLEAGVREASKYKFWHKHSPTMYGWVEEWLGQAMIHYSRKPKPKQQDLTL